jgi:hypothetical protein
MSYQKCPLCEGFGKIPNTEDYMHSSSAWSPNITCPVCKGELIIDTKTGLPPSLNTYHTSNDDLNKEISIETKQLLGVE